MKKANAMISALALLVVTFSSCKKDEMSSPSGMNDFSSARVAGGDAGAIYVLDNAPAGNHVMIFSRQASGILNAAGSVATGGNGTGSGLGSQGAVTSDDKYVYAVNAGSNEISVMQIDGSSLTLVDKVSSAGTTPISITHYGNWLYVLNAGGSGNISGFLIGSDGHLTHVAGSDQPLSTSASGGAQVQFNNDGTQLVVTEKATNRITVYPVSANGVAGPGNSSSSAGTTPFGFAFGKNNVIIVSEAFGGAPLASALSSYSVNGSGNANLVTGPIGTHQTAACWVAVTNNGRFAYTTNTGSASISMYSIGQAGELELINSMATGITPIDVALSRNSRFLYNLNNGDHSISMFNLNPDGTLQSMGAITGLPAGSVGLAAN
jgi:6-phosphogluconolactonase